MQNPRLQDLFLRKLAFKPFLHERDEKTAALRERFAEQIARKRPRHCVELVEIDLFPRNEKVRPHNAPNAEGLIDEAGVCTNLFGQLLVKLGGKSRTARSPALVFLGKGENI